MAKYRNKYVHRKTSSSNWSKWLILLTIGVAVVASSILVASQILDRRIVSANDTISNKNIMILEIEETLPLIEEEIDSLKEKTTELEYIIWRYSPVIIPESMKE